MHRVIRVAESRLCKCGVGCNLWSNNHWGMFLAPFGAGCDVLVGRFYGFCQKAKLERTGLLHLSIGFVGSDGLSGVSFVAMSEETGVAVEACRVG